VLVRPCTPGPGVVLLGGSEGGVSGAFPTAMALADRGWWCLVVGYLGVEDTPSVLSEVPLEPVLAAIAWLADHDGVLGPGVALWGASKGAEAAIVVATLSSAVTGVVSVSGSPVVFEGLDPRCRTSSWTVAGQALPFTRMRRLHALTIFARKHKVATLRPIYERGLRAVSSAGGSTSHLDLLAVPVLMITGSDDRFWPAREMAERAERRVSCVRTLNLSDTGHLIPPPGIPPVTEVGSMPALRTGGLVEAAPGAVCNAWNATTAFLAELQSSDVHSRR
jgi:uncharacterized protein